MKIPEEVKQEDINSSQKKSPVRNTLLKNERLARLEQPDTSDSGSSQSSSSDQEGGIEEILFGKRRSSTTQWELSKRMCKQRKRYLLQVKEA